SPCASRASEAIRCLGTGRMAVWRWCQYETSTARIATASSSVPAASTVYSFRSRCPCLSCNICHRSRSPAFAFGGKSR
ncbi:unnamed protein product, partial [Ectocarpus sp. 12 AP-2014]